jgi:hypothetical protein
MCGWAGEKRGRRRRWQESHGEKGGEQGGEMGKKASQKGMELIPYMRSAVDCMRCVLFLLSDMIYWLMKAWIGGQGKYSTVRRYKYSTVQGDFAAGSYLRTRL